MKSSFLKFIEPCIDIDVLLQKNQEKLPLESKFHKEQIKSQNCI